MKKITAGLEAIVVPGLFTFLAPTSPAACETMDVSRDVPVAGTAKPAVKP